MENYAIITNKRNKKGLLLVHKALKTSHFCVLAEKVGFSLH